MADISSADEQCLNGSVVRDRVICAAGLTVLSSCLSIFGSSLIILSFLLWQDVRRSMARIILLFLALADLGAALGYLISSVGYIIQHRHLYEDNTTFHYSHVYNTFCTWSSFFTTFFPLASFFWTAYLAIYFVVALVLKKPRWSYKLLVIFNITAWIIPLVICIVAVFFGTLGGSASSLSGGWSFVSYSGTKNNYHYDYLIFLLLEGVYGKFWEVAAFCVIVICYTAIFCINRRLCSFDKCFSWTDKVNFTPRRSNSVQINSALSAAISKIDLKLLLIPLFFLILRSAGFYRYFLSMFPQCRPHVNITIDDHNCVITKDCFNLAGNYYVMFLQAITEPLQGFTNAVLFVFFSKVIMYRFLHLCCCRRCCCQRRSRQLLYTESLTTSSGTERRSQSPFNYNVIDRYDPVVVDRNELEEDYTISSRTGGYGSTLNSGSHRSIN